MISKKTKYAINALVYIAKNKKHEPISVMTISEHQNIPVKFLENILFELKKAKILSSKRGKYGGYLLNDSPDNIHMAQVMRLFDGAIALLPCVTYNYYEKCEECVDEATCGIRQVAMEIRNETVKRLKESTLKDIIQREAILKNESLNPTKD
ncbi:Rrf2 family transcriptional regulator [Weeksellaceae bacterium KMM 9713]|uniref:Rrf2 family transcriptional regulator n=1 Tax=Profundicola chukchiensis TaxID=2961959 RepID=A0A9X4MXS2_9FLAO|nr:Rrf2 family transcriptional regulator [Profundicola chukchiensis]MDG4946838.1 Rrf2 family transcriptional regulator [Profundicola chukchiensis]MDG4951344.1 Rrf2 family transcriptional regulator [Profundicola chukchiensis]